MVVRQTKTYPCECVSCGECFEAKSPLAKTCSKPCQHLQNGWLPSTLARPVFDHFFVVPIDDRWCRRVTSQKLDWQFMEMGLRVTGEAALPGKRVTDRLFA